MDTNALIARIAQIIDEKSDGRKVDGGPCEHCRCNHGRIVAKEIVEDLEKDYVIVTQREYNQMKKDLADFDKFARDVSDIKSFGHVRYTDDSQTLHLLKSADGTHASTDIREIIAYGRMCGVENRFKVVTEDK